MYLAYHDEEWGVPSYDAQRLFEFLMLEGMQAGLSWLTILRKRVHFRQVFSNFDPEKIALFGVEKIQALLQDPGIIRHEGKIRAIITNARCFLEMPENFSDFIWQFTEGKPIKNAWKKGSDIPTVTMASRAMSASLKKRGFRFVGETICYAYMQAIGMVNDHLVDCFRYEEC